MTKNGSNFASKNCCNTKGERNFAGSLFQGIVTASSIGFLVYFIFFNIDEFTHLLRSWQDRQATWSIFPAIIACYLLSWLIVAAQYHTCLRRIGLSVKFIENAALVVASALLNYSPVKLGILYRLNYLNSRHRVPYGALASIQLIRFFLLLGVSGLFGFIAISFIYISEGNTDTNLFLLTVLAILVSTTPIVITSGIISSKLEKWRSIFTNFFSTTELISKDIRAILALCMLSLAQFAVLVVQYRLIFDLVGLTPPFSTYFILVPLVTALSLVSITPGNLGLREMLLAAVMSMTHNTFNSGIIAGVVDRGALILSTAIFGTLAILYLELIRRKEPKSPPEKCP